MKKTETYSTVSGLIFLISGVAKALDAAAFANVILQYGFESVQFLAPIIILAEIFIGLMLVFQIYLKPVALAGALLVVFFTIMYLYGIAFRGVNDCGCFGKITALNTSPVFTFVRNAVLLYMLIVLWQKGENTGAVHSGIAGAILLVMCLIAFISGYTYRRSVKSMIAKRYVPEAIQNTALKDFISTSKDSTYWLFAFSYTCPHCLNSIENLKRYEQLGVVDQVIGLAMTDSVAEQKFNEIFQVNFQIQNVKPSKLFRLTNEFPHSYIIRNDSVIAELSGELPCAYLIRQVIR
jgi:uncharacterized membrane protein YphA (DoxX/SURF4 family)